MRYYREEHILTGKRGNNAFSYDERAQIRGGRPAPEISLPVLREIQTLDEVVLGKTIVFEEMEDGVLRSCSGLAGLYRFEYGEKKMPVYVMDNHNHALYCWARERVMQGWQKPATLFHIDQHKDMRNPGVYLTPADFEDIEKVAVYTNEVLNVGNFIVPGVQGGLISHVEMMDHSGAFEHVPDVDSTSPVVVDIDLDIFCEELAFYGFDRIVDVSRELIKKADVVTIATSPYFIDQERACTYLKILFYCI